jgi:hypothetical protein
MFVQIELLTKSPGAYLKVTFIKFEDLNLLMVDGNEFSDMNQASTSRKDCSTHTRNEKRFGTEMKQELVHHLIEQ